jgi:hypothetical protein
MHHTGRECKSWQSLRRISDWIIEADRCKWRGDRARRKTHGSLAGMPKRHVAAPYRSCREFCDRVARRLGDMLTPELDRDLKMRRLFCCLRLRFDRPILSQ